MFQKHKNNVVTFGYGASNAIAYIFWYQNNEVVHVTHCYSEEEVTHMLERHNTPGDFYSTMHPVVERLIKDPEKVAA